MQSAVRVRLGPAAVVYAYVLSVRAVRLSLYIVQRAAQPRSEVGGIGQRCQTKERHIESAAPKGEQPHRPRCSKDEYGFSGRKFAVFFRNLSSVVGQALHLLLSGQLSGSSDCSGGRRFAGALWLTHVLGINLNTSVLPSAQANGRTHSR
jgi:hypothetical protein